MSEHPPRPRTDPAREPRAEGPATESSRRRPGLLPPPVFPGRGGRPVEPEADRRTVEPGRGTSAPEREVPRGLERRRSRREHDGALDPHVAELSARVSGLASALRIRGEPALRVIPGMDRFDATLRSYCVGYLASRRGGGAP